MAQEVDGIKESQEKDYSFKEEVRNIGGKRRA
jgi:hypothetical protein